MRTLSPTKERPFDVWRLVNGVQRRIGVVTGVNRTLADRRAMNLYGSGVWTTERD